MLRKFAQVLVYNRTMLTANRIKSLEQEIEGLQGSSTRSHGRR